MQFVDSRRAVEKKTHGRIPDNKNRGYFSIWILSICENTKLKMAMVNMGFKKIHKKPRLDPLYLTFKFRRVRFISISL